MRSALCVIALALAACGSKQPPAREDLDEPPVTKNAGTQPNSAGKQPVGKHGSVAAVSEGPPPACAAKFGEATGTCAVSQECTYPEGTCRCEQPRHCSGANLRRPPEPLEWSCEANPPKVRADGCPGTEPAGDACTSERKECTYGTCCVKVLTCEGGHWLQKKPAECPP